MKWNILVFLSLVLAVQSKDETEEQKDEGSAPHRKLTRPLFPYMNRYEMNVPNYNLEGRWRLEDQHHGIDRSRILDERRDWHGDDRHADIYEQLRREDAWRNKNDGVYDGYYRIDDKLRNILEKYYRELLRNIILEPYPIGYVAGIDDRDKRNYVYKLITRSDLDYHKKNLGRPSVLDEGRLH